MLATRTGKPSLRAIRMRKQQNKKAIEKKKQLWGTFTES